VLRAGTYQINVRLAGCNTQNGQCLRLQKNGEDIAQCHQSDGNNYQNTAQLLEIMTVDANVVFQVRCEMNANLLAVKNASRFTILRLGN
jgi:hypothetical protein